jgi:hypothetical protein
MPAPTQSREFMTFSYDPRSGPPWMVDYTRTLEGFLNRLEQRIEKLQDVVAALEARVVTLEAGP